MAATTDVHALTATELASAFQKGDLSPVTVTRALLDRIAAMDPILNAFSHLDHDETLAQAEAAESRHLTGEILGPLDGVPVAVKDGFLTRGWPTLRGSRLVDPDQPWPVDSPAVARLRDGGAVLLGKTAMPEFGWKGLTDSALLGVTRNPWDTSKTPGGSSGGSAAALAAGMAPLALGTDGGGSIRIPGSFAGTVGLKPTFGLVPYAPMSPFGTVSHAGPMARTVDDAAVLLETLAVYDRRDWTALPTRAAGLRPEGGASGLRVLFSLTLGFAEVDPKVAKLVSAAVELIEGLGADITAEDPGLDDPTGTWQTLWYGGAAAIVDGLDPSRLDEVDPGLLEIAAEGRELSALDYVRAFRSRVEVATTLGAVLDDYDLLITPTMPIAAFEAGVDVPAGWPSNRWETWSPFSLPFNLSQQPAITVPCGTTPTGLPVGLQIVAAKHRDDLVLRTARAYEAARSDGASTFVRPLGTV